MNNKNDYHSENEMEFPPVNFDYTPTPISEIQEKRDQLGDQKWINKRARVEKIVIKKNFKNIQPGECMKFMEVDFDYKLSLFDFHEESQRLLKNARVNTWNSSLIIPSSLKWTRKVEIYTVDINNEIVTARREETQDDTMIIWNWDTAVKKIHDQSFQESLDDIAKVVPDKKISLVIYKMEGYFSYYKGNGKRKLEPAYHNIDELPKISRQDFEYSVVNAQITSNFSITCIEKPHEMISMILQYTKAIAENPYKISMMQSHVQSGLKFYAFGDNKNTIKVDGNGFGLKNLWLRQICLFHTAGFATAQAICEQYPSPAQLMKAYEKCSPKEGQALLQDILIRRGPIELCKPKRLGPELSKKMYIMYTSADGSQVLGK
ncbi:crossover junction endonuclease EME1 [Diachasmimorpha longicaudata]|uniref:crossover junction endonuclease EME1 n=1 Tax=Diachasmimorpha longicaudata TaxID=58733 RepID=UPI0030B8EAB5